MTIPWGPQQGPQQQEPSKYEPPEGYKLKKTKPFYQRFLFWIPIAFVVIIVIAAVSQGDTGGSKTASDTVVSVTAQSSMSSSASVATAIAPAEVVSSEPSKAPDATSGVIGKPVQVKWSGDDTGTVTVYSAKWVKPGADDFIKPDHGAYLVIDVGYVATAGTVSYNPLYWSLRDADGREYDASLIPLDKYSPGLNSGDLAPGVKARGFVAFDAPQQAITVELSGIFLSGSLMTWQVPAP